MKKGLSILLVLSTILSCITPVFAEETTDTTEIVEAVAEEMEAEESATDELILNQETKEPISEEQNEENIEEAIDEPSEESDEEVDEEIIAELTDGEATQDAPEEEPEIETEVSEDETYMLNIVLFALSESASIESIEGKLEDLGISQIKPLFTDEDGNAKPIGKKNEVWYRAYTSEDVYETVDALNNIKGVTYSEPEYIYTSDSHGLPKDFDASRDWPIKKHLQPHKNGKDWFWWYEEYGHTFAPGHDTIVAVIDTGVDYTHEDLASNMWVNTAEMYGTEGVDDDLNGYIDDIYGVDTTATGKKAGNPMDDNGHGTHVAGIIGMSANGEGGIGLAYGTKIMAIKAGQSTGTLASSHIAKAINYAHMMGADVINMSFGGSSQSYLVETALEDAFSDCVLVASAGNDGIPTNDADPALYPKRADVYPAGYSYVLGVMATDKNGNLASFSNWDYTPNANCEYELTAPGKDIYSTLPGNRYAKWSGTSMAAPFVAATAAIIRSHYDDKDTYSSRFIMGQISSATTEVTNYVSKDGSYSYPALSVYDSIYYLPKPNLSVKDMFLMDNKENGEINDGDSIIDAGEVIDLGVLIRNQWGQTGEITVKADAISDMGVANPWIEFVTDEITLQPAGTFQEVNNGFVWNDSYLESIDNPIQFKISSETPNDTEIRISITVTTTNGIDEDDNATYTAEAEHIFRVQAGRGISGTLTEDTTLTNDYLWIIENSLYIPEGITLTIEPGTKVQFYSSDYEDAYGGLTIANIVCDGTLNAIGTEDQPIEMYPGVGFENYCCHIYGGGKETLKYCNIINPLLGYNYNSSKLIYAIDHCNLIQNYLSVYFRRVSEGKTITSRVENNLGVATLSNSSLKCITGYTNLTTSITNSIGNQFVKCNFDYYIGNKEYKNNVVIGGYPFDAIPESNYRNILRDPIRITMEMPTFNEIFTYEGASSKYVLMNPYNYSFNLDLARSVANSLGGTLACFNDEIEEKFLYKYLYQLGEATRIEGETRQIDSFAMIGYTRSQDGNSYSWDDGNSYVPSAVSTQLSFGDNNPSSTNVNMWAACHMSNYTRHISSVSGGSDKHIMLEFPAEYTDEEITVHLNSFDYIQWLRDYHINLTNNAFLNPVLNTNPESWLKIQASSYNFNCFSDLARNYWGTENKTLINKMIVDADDYAGTYQDIIEDPILTLESESLQDIYPFVTKVYLTDADGNIVSNVQPGETYNVHVHFNRDMDMDTQPSVSYGGAEPYTDYMVYGDFVSAREWVGTTRISPVLTSGTMYWRTKGGCAADDKWLVCGEDILRFSFNISSNGVLAMLLNAEGGANKVDLSWAQNDYETLAGYNIYRSTSENSGFKKINLSILTDTEYTDTDVLPGVTYYYYFKVVNTDGNEEGNVSNTASAAPIDNIFPVLKHSPVATAKAGSQVTISATATDNIAVSEVKLYYKKAGDTNFQSKKMTESATKNLYVAVIPATYVKEGGVAYYITVSDADGNTSYSGTKEIPNMISVNTNAYISGITPSKIQISGGKTIAILGGNFTSDMTLKVGGTVISEYSLIDAGQINFVAPQKASGSYAVTLTTPDGATVTSPTTLSYEDVTSIAQIPTSLTLVSGAVQKIPFYATAEGDIVALHAELDLPTADFTSVKVEKADATAQFQLDYTYSGGVLKIGCIGTSNFKPTDGALLNIVVTPKVTEDKQYTLKLHDVSFNGVDVYTVISGEAILKPSYALNATVKYFMGTNNFVPGTVISAGGINATTNNSGFALLEAIPVKSVTVTASNVVSPYAITSYDASLVLQSCLDKITLTDNQKLAADVDGNGKVNEYDAALILQKAVRKIDIFPSGNVWLFTPSFIEKTLSATSTNSAAFTAIVVGDVDGSYRGDAK